MQIYRVSHLIAVGAAGALGAMSRAATWRACRPLRAVPLPSPPLPLPLRHVAYLSVSSRLHPPPHLLIFFLLVLSIAPKRRRRRCAFPFSTIQARRRWRVNLNLACLAGGRVPGFLGCNPSAQCWLDWTGLGWAGWEHPFHHLMPDSHHRITFRALLPIRCHAAHYSEFSASRSKG